MTTVNEVLSLIKSLSKSEKRYFSLHAKKSTSKTSNQLKLFKVLCTMEAYEEKLVRQKLNGEKLLERLSIELNHLYYALLKSLKDFHYEKSEQAKIRDYIFKAQLLRDRNLPEQAQNLLDKAKLIAEEFDEPLELLQINRLQRALIHQNLKKKKTITLEELVHSKNRQLEKLELEFKWYDINSGLVSLFQKQLRSKIDNQQKLKLNKAYDKLLNITEFDELTLIGKQRYLQSRAFYYLHNNNFEASNRHFLELIAWWDNHKAFKKEQFYTYSRDVLNYLAICFIRNKLDLILEMIEKLEQQQEKSAEEEFFLFRLDAKYRFLILINKGAVQEASSMIPKMERGLNKYNLPKSTFASITYNISSFFFLKEDYSSTITFLKKLDKIGEQRKDIQMVAKLFLIISMYEEGDLDQLENYLRKCHRYFKKEQDLGIYSFFHSILNFLKRIINTPVFESKAILTEFKDYLLKQKSNPESKVIAGLDEFLLWTRSKLEHKPILTILPTIS